MTMDFRRVVALDSTVGAGNFFFKFAECWPDKGSVVLESDKPFVIGAKDYGTTLTVSQLRGLVEQLASWFSKRGVRAGHLVAVFIDDTAAYYIYYLAITHVGAIPTLLNSNMQGSVASNYLCRVGCFALVTDRERAARFDRQATSVGQGATIFLTDTIALVAGESDHEQFSHNGGDNVLIAHTSGTTGPPKPVQFNHSGFFYGVRRQMYHALGRRALSVLPHSHGSAITLFMSTMVRGVPLFAQSNKNAESVLGSIERWKPNLVMAFPKPLMSLCRTNLESRDLTAVSCWMSTGDASHERHIRILSSMGSRTQGGVVRKGSLYIDNLGSSEFSFGIFRQIHSPETSKYDRCIGRPFEWVDVKLFGEDGRPVLDNEVGRLGVKSPSVTSGYWNDSAATEMNLLDGYWLTGDLLFRDADGLYYHVDRTTDRGLIDNRMIYSCQLEEILIKRVSDVFDCTVVCVDSEPKKRSVAVAVEPVDMRCDVLALQEQIRIVLKMNGVNAPVNVEIVDPGWNEGLTGKKLKRLIRTELSAARAL